MAGRAEAIAAAADVYKAILADPERAAAIRAHREQQATELASQPDPARPTERRSA